jgi:hypothetical protein
VVAMRTRPLPGVAVVVGATSSLPTFPTSPPLGTAALVPGRAAAAAAGMLLYAGAAFDTPRRGDSGQPPALAHDTGTATAEAPAARGVAGPLPPPAQPAVITPAVVRGVTVGAVPADSTVPAVAVAALAAVLVVWAGVGPGAIDVAPAPPESLLQMAAAVAAAVAVAVEAVATGGAAAAAGTGAGAGVRGTRVLLLWAVAWAPVGVGSGGPVHCSSQGWLSTSFNVGRLEASSCSI